MVLCDDIRGVGMNVGMNTCLLFRILFRLQTVESPLNTLI